MRRPVTAAVIIGGLLAVTVAATGGAVAGTLITSRQIKDGTIVSADVKNGTLTSADVKDGTLAGIDVKSSSIGVGDLQRSARAGLSEWINLVPGAAPVPNFDGVQVRSTSPGLDGQVQAVVRPEGEPDGVFCVFLTPTALSRLNLEAVSLTLQRSTNRPAFGTATTVYAHDACTGSGTLLEPPDTGRSYDVAINTFTVNPAGDVVPTDVGVVLGFARAG